MSLIFDNLQREHSLHPLRVKDIERVYEIEVDVYTEPWSPDLLEDSLKAPMTYSLAIFDQQLCVAYGLYQVVFTEGHLLNLAVARDYQGFGLGSALLDKILEDSSRRGAASFFLEVRPSNRGAKALYQKRGFQPLMLRDSYYRDGEAALIMILDIQRWEKERA